MITMPSLLAAFLHSRIKKKLTMPTPSLKENPLEGGAHIDAQTNIKRLKAV
jgi:hypothetical protein